MQNKYARICWNTSGWRMPSGDAIEGDSYVAKHGFGHEEWLFNYEWLIDDYRYGFLQPIRRFYKSYSEEICSILMYTRTPEQQTLLVGTIDRVYIPAIEELEEVLRVFDEKGWLQTMRDDVRSVQGDVAVLSEPSAGFIANIKFRPENVELFNPMPRVPETHKISKYSRYQPFDWDDDGFPSLNSQA